MLKPPNTFPYYPRVSPCPPTFSGSYMFKIVMSACWRRDRTGDVLHVEDEDFIVIELLKK